MNYHHKERRKTFMKKYLTHPVWEKDAAEKFVEMMITLNSKEFLTISSILKNLLMRSLVSLFCNRFRKGWTKLSLIIKLVLPTTPLKVTDFTFTLMILS